MESTRYVNLPIVGMVQHGIVDEKAKRVKELGYFIGKTKDELMKAHLDKFNELYKGKQSIDILVFNEEPFTVKYSRYNKMGEACSCNIESNTATEKTKNGWQKIECNSNCPYRQKNESGKSACNRVGWLKFLVPSVCKDRVFLMKVTGQTSINTLQTYFDFIKLQGISAKGYYTLCLKQKTQTNSLGNTFNNYVLDILKKEDFILTNQIPQITENNEILSTDVTNNVDSVPTKQVENTEKSVVTQVVNNAGTDRKKATSKTKVSKDTTKKQAETTTKVDDNSNKVKTENQEKQQQVVNTPITSLVPEDTKVETENEKRNSAEQTQETPKESFDNVYGLIKTFYKKVKMKNGDEKEYLVGEFADINDQMCQICIRPENSEELANCELGTLVKMDIKQLGNVKFAMKLEYIQKLVKKNVA